ncbi:hypothetical protein CBR_g51951 [Chara braunii]|uniref:Uncharacterized protein n=1 Tax=Chara braunii TaxID=69332 RepID=A0A388K6J4_CHABU|nr:hypothetical protein CBR_g51951 [Chara braunii]|eukprot:GBG65651.1 hypothetical protein CBR_g51951 [Chara braunii]
MGVCRLEKGGSTILDDARGGASAPRAKCFCLFLMFSLLVRFLCLYPLGQPAASTSRAYSRSKIYNNKPWALDWVGGLHKPGCGAVVFLSDDNGATWYCCGGVEKSESARNTYDGRSFRTFFLTSVFDKDGTNWVKEDKKVGLDLRLFQGYDVKAFSMKAFDVRGDGAELHMLTAEQFLSRTNGYRVTGCLPVVDSSLELTKPLVKFSSPADQLPGVVKEYREAFSRLPLDQLTALSCPLSRARGNRDRRHPHRLGRGNSWLLVQLRLCQPRRPRPCPRVQEGATALIERNEDEEDGGSCGYGGDDEYMDVGDENMQDQNMLGDDDVGVTSEHGPGDIPVGSVGAAVGRPLSSPAIWHSQGGSQGGHDSQEHGGSKSRKRTRETSPSASAHKRQSRTDVVNEARGALIASQEARPPRKSSQGGRSGGHGGGRGGARKGKQVVRAKELQDSGDEGEGVGPRMPDDGDEPLQHAAPIDMMRCFFLEYDERGFAKQKVFPVLVDVMKIKRIPCGNILFNHRSLSANIVRGIENAIESSITTEPRAWDRPELVLAPVDRNEIVGRQGRRITPTEFFEKDSSEFDWYAVCGQHTVEAMKTLVKKGSPTVDVYGLRTYSKREVALLLLMKGKVVATNVKVMPPRVNTECLLDIMRKERYMVRMFNYVVFRAEGRADDEWNDAFFMSYKDLEDKYGPNGLCAAEWEKERDKLHVSKVKTVPRRLGGVEEARQGSGLGPTAAMYKEAPFHFKVQSDVLRCLFRWEDIELILGTWKRVDRSSNDITKYDNIATASRDMIAIVLHVEGGDLRKVTIAPHLSNDLTNVHVVEEKFGKYLGKHGGIEGDESVVYSIWEREPGKLRPLCGSFVGEAEGVLLLGRAHAGLVWEFLLAGNNVIACNELVKDIAYLTKFIAILVKDDRFNCHVEKPRCKHRPNRDMFHKLGRKRLKVWEYLFRDMPQGRLDGKYIYRKAKATETLKHYHAHDDRTVHSHGGSIPMAAPSVASMVAPSETAALQDIGRCGDNEEDDIEIPGQSEASIKAKVEKLFHVLHDNRQLEYNNKFYALRSSPSRMSINWKVDQTARTLEGSCSHDFMPSAEPASVAAQAGHRGDDGTTVVGPQEVDITSKPQISEKSISVAAAQSSPPIDVSTTLPSDAGATYGSLLITNAAMQGRSKIESESDVWPSVAESQLQPSLCTGKGDAQSPLTPQGGAGGDGGKGGDVERMHRSRNLDTLTADID